MQKPIVLGGALWVTVGLQAPALAHTVRVEEAFKDVPGHHWAADAVVQMAVARGLMKGFPDDTFRGEAPFTRARFAVSLKALIGELEERSKASWKTGSPANATLADVGAANPDRESILSLVNDYHLWEAVPVVDSGHFRPDETVTRSEVAQVVRNLLAAGEKLGVVLARDPRDPQNRFKDLSPSEWAYQAILADDKRFGVMIGFPDSTFRARERLTRYQYAAVGASTFGVIHELVRKTAIERELLAPAPRKTRFQELRPLALSFAPGTALGPGAAGLSLNGSIRYVGYPGSWFWIGALRGGTLTGGGTAGSGAPASATSGGPSLSLTAGAFPQMPVTQLGGLGQLQLQPYVGARLLGGGSVGASAGFPVLGGVAYLHRDHWGAFLLGDTHFLVGGGGGTTLDPGGTLGLGAEYSLSDGLAITGGLRLDKLPSGLAVGPTVGLDVAL